MPTVEECFSVRIVDQSRTYDGFIIVVFTNIPAHLWLRWTTVTPQKHIVPSYRRGIYMHGDTYFCFVAPTDLEQVETGDTLIHTFILSDWPSCETRHFVFIATINGLPSPSTSPIFDKHFKEEEAPPFPTYQMVFYGNLENRTIRQTHANWDTAHDAATGAIQTYHGPPQYLVAAGASLIVTYWIHRAFLYFDTTELPNLANIVAATLSIYVFNTAMTSSVAYPHLCVTHAVNYAPVQPAYYGNQLPVTTIGGKKRIDELILGQYNDIPLNFKGFHSISPFNPSGFCLRGELDVFDIPPPLGENFVTFYSAQKGSSYRPKLTVEYTLEIPPPKADAFWEPWGTYLDQYTQWGLWNGLTHADLSFTAGVLKLSNPGIWDCGISNWLIPQEMPIIGQYGNHVHFLYNCPDAYVDTPESQMNFEIWFRKNNQRFQIALSIRRGTGYGPWPQINSYDENHIWKDIGIGPQVVDLVDLFAWTHLQLGIPIDYEGWLVETIAIAVGVLDFSTNDFLHCDYIGLDYR